MKARLESYLNNSNIFSCRYFILLLIYNLLQNICSSTIKRKNIYLMNKLENVSVVKASVNLCCSCKAID